METALILSLVGLGVSAAITIIKYVTDAIKAYKLKKAGIAEEVPDKELMKDKTTDKKEDDKWSEIDLNEKSMTIKAKDAFMKLLPNKFKAKKDDNGNKFTDSINFTFTSPKGVEIHGHLREEMTPKEMETYIKGFIDLAGGVESHSSSKGS